LQKLLDFEINDVKLERLIDDTTALVKLRIVTEGQNKHNLPMSIDVIKEAAERSLRGKPILATYSNWRGDLEGHRRPQDSEPIGYIIETQNFEYSDTPTGKALFALGLLWKRYAPYQTESIYDGKDHSKSVSMEISVDSLIDENNPSAGISSMSFLGICVLGEKYPPASEEANLKLLTFSEMKNKYEVMFAMESMKINNSKESAVKSSSWANPGRRLYQILLSKSNKLSLLKEAYLIIDESKIDTAPSEAFSYPHHSIKNGELVVNSKGVQSAFSRARQQNIARGEVLEHLKKHYKELNLDMSNFSTDFQEKEESKLEDKVMMQEPEEEKKFEVEKPASESEPEKAEENKEENTEEKEEEKEEEDFACKFAEASKQLEEFAVKYAALEEEVNGLRKYKAEREESDKKFAIEQTMAEVNEYLPKDEAEKFRAEAAEVKFSEVEAFKNKIKARSLDFAKTSQVATNRMAIVRDNEEKKDKWGW
jgi:hypothetical protein